MQDRNESEVVVITGASAGVGRATAIEFARHGARIGLLARGQDGLEGAKRDVEEHGGEALIIPTDVADYDAVERAADAVEKQFGPIDVWVNNAMTAVFAPVKEMRADEYKRVTEVTYLGQVHGTMAALKRMQPRDRGAIILVGSALAYRGIPLQSSYCAAKHAIQGFFDSLRSELMHDNSQITLTMVQLAGMNTPQFEWVRCKLPHQPKPLGGCYQPEVAAEAIYYAAHHNRREIYVGSAAVEAIVGNKILPDYADHHLANIGFKGQQTDQPVSSGRQDNLYGPVPGDHGVHGPFGQEAKTFSPQLWADLHRGVLATGAVAAAGFLAAATWLGGDSH